MAIKYKNPPVIYTAAKVIYNSPIGNYGENRYKQLLSGLESLGLDSYSISKINGIQFKQSENQFSATPTNAERIGYFSPDRQKCALIDEHFIELRLSKYTDHRCFLDDFKSLIDLCLDNGITSGNKPREIELHYVDLFAPRSNTLSEMFADKVTLPIRQFYNDASDMINVGATSFTRVLSSGKSKVSVNLEQLRSLAQGQRKCLPDTLSEPDNNLAMPLNVDRLFKNESLSHYAIVHTECASLLPDDGIDSAAMRDIFEGLYAESQKTFVDMINSEVCDIVWEKIDK